MTDIKTTIQRKYGLSAEDADKVVTLVAEETMQRYFDSQPTPAASPTRETPMPIVINVYVDDRLREGITTDVVKVINDRMCETANRPR